MHERPAASIAARESASVSRLHRWFRAQPLHRKFVLISMVKTTLVLTAAMASLLLLDSWRFQQGASLDAQTLATLVAEHSGAALASGDIPSLSATLETVRLRQQVQRVCAYDVNDRLLTQYTREPSFQCPLNRPRDVPWFVLAATVPVTNQGATVGQIYLDRDWAALRDRLVAAGIASLGVLTVAFGFMLVVSNRLNRRISEPLTRLAAAAREMGQTERFEMPDIPTPPDEVGDLVQSFRAMVDRVNLANQDLSRTNDALRREIEDRRRIEAEREDLLRREQESGRLKDEFLATVSHELRTPLNAILGWARVLTMTEPDSATVAKAAASVHRNAQAQARVIDDLIDISRIVTGKLRVMAEPIDLRRVVDAAVDTIGSAADHAGITLTVRLPPDPAVIQGDRDRLQQIVLNLLSNAVKFAPGGLVTVEVQDRDTEVHLVVSDNGVGIPPEFLRRVFDRFRQADSSITREHGGLGIGLAVVRELVDLHGGRIRAESEGRGKGAAFTVVFAKVATEARPGQSDESAPSLSGVSVLVVDDNADTLEILDTVLTGAGATVRSATSGADAVDLWREQPADVLLCDLAMPHMSGFQLLERIRDLDRASARMTPAIAVTAHATEESVVRSAQAGFQLHVSKPFDAARLVRAVSSARVRS